MLGHIGQLQPVVGRVRISAVLHLLITVIGRQFHRVAPVELMAGRQRGVESSHPHLAHVDALPDEHVMRHRYDLVLHVVLIAVEGEAQLSVLQWCQGIRKADVQLVGRFGLEVGAAVVEVVALIERGRTEDIFVRGTHEELLRSKRLVAQRERGRQAVHVAGTLSLLCVVQIERVQQTGGSLQLARAPLGRERLQDGVTIRARVGRERTVEAVVDIIS